MTAKDHGSDPIQQILGNSSLILAARATAISLNLITVPIILNANGVGGFAKWEALLGITILFASIQYIYRSTLAWVFGFHAKKGSSERIRWCRAAGAVATISSVSILTIGTLLRALLQKTILPELSGVPLPEWLLPAALVPLAISTWTEIRVALLIADHRSGMVACLQTLAMAAQATTSIALLYSKFGIWSLPLAQTLASTLHALLLRNVLIRQDAAVTLFPGLIYKDQARVFSSYAKHLLIGTACTTLRGAFDRIFLSATGNTTLLAAYGVASRIATIINELTNLIYVPATAKATEIAREGNHVLLANFHRGLTGYLTWLLIPAIAFLAPTSEILAFLWTGKHIEDFHLVLAMLMVSTSFASIVTGPSTAILKGSGHPRAESSYLAVTLILNIGLMAPMLMILPGLGTVASSSLAWILGSVFFAKYPVTGTSDQPRLGTTKILIAFAALSTPFLVHSLAEWLTARFSASPSSTGLALELASSLTISYFLAKRLAPPPGIPPRIAKLGNFMRSISSRVRMP